jgi:hypothetical protein
MWLSWSMPFELCAKPARHLRGIWRWSFKEHGDRGGAAAPQASWS